MFELYSCDFYRAAWTDLTIHVCGAWSLAQLREFGLDRVDILRPSEASTCFNSQ